MEMPITYGRYPSCPHTIPNKSIPPQCQELMKQLKECEARVYPNQSNCLIPNMLLRLCLRTRKID